MDLFSIYFRCVKSRTAMRVGMCISFGMFACRKRFSVLSCVVCIFRLVDRRISIFLGGMCTPHRTNEVVFTSNTDVDEKKW